MLKYKCLLSLKMNSKLLGINNSPLSITLLFLLFIVLSNISLPGKAYGEAGYVEMLQVILIVSVVIVGFLRKGYLIKAYSRTTYWLRQFLFSFLLFEEISYLTTDKLNFLGYNKQAELNFHNSYFLDDNLLSLTLLGDDAFHMNPRLIISFFVVVFLFAGSKVSFFKRFSIIYLHPLVSVGILFYPLNLVFSYLIRNLFVPDLHLVVHEEMIELFLYIVFLMDILIKSYPRLICGSCK